MMTQKNHKKALAAEQKSLIFLAALIALLLLIFSLCSEWFFVPGNLFNIVRQIADIGMIASVYKGIHIKTTKNGLPTY
ncbi:MAG: hypothetical protein ACLR5X_09790 [Oscillospiraceae bacterium]|nr:hypothetical protein [Clostridiales bacterium]